MFESDLANPMPEIDVLAFATPSARCKEDITSTKEITIKEEGRPSRAGSPMGLGIDPWYCL